MNTNKKIINFYSKYIKYKYKYTNLKNQFGGKITPQGLSVNYDYIMANINYCNHAIKIFNIDFIADKIILFNDRYVKEKPILSIGSGHGLLEAYIYNKSQTCTSFYAIEPEKNPEQNTFISLDFFFWKPDSNSTNATNFRKALNRSKGIIDDRSLLLNWCYPNLNYDFDYITQFKPYSILSINGGLRSDESILKLIYLNKIIYLLFIKNIKYENLKVIIKLFFKNNDEFLKEFNNKDNYDENYEVTSLPILIERIKIFFDLYASNNTYDEKLVISYDILFYLNKYLLFLINSNDKKFKSSDVTVADITKITAPTKESFDEMRYDATAGGKEFHKFIEEIQSGSNIEYNIITFHQIKYNIYLDCDIVNIYDFNYLIYLILKNPVSDELKQNAEHSTIKEINIKTTIEHIIYDFLIKTNNKLLEKFNNIIRDKIRSHSNMNFLTKIIENLQNFYVFDAQRFFIRREDDESINQIIFNMGEHNYKSLLNL